MTERGCAKHTGGPGRWRLGSSLFTRRGLAALRGLPLPRHTAHRRDESLELLTWLDTHIAQLDAQIAIVAAADPAACRLMTHPGVGPLTALATILVLGPVNRFPSSKHAVSYIGWIVIEGVLPGPSPELYP